MIYLKALSPGDADIAADGEIRVAVICRIKRIYSVEAERGGGLVPCAVVEFESSAGIGWSRQGVMLRDVRLMLDDKGLPLPPQLLLKAS